MVTHQQWTDNSARMLVSRQGVGRIRHLSGKDSLDSSIGATARKFQLVRFRQLGTTVTLEQSLLCETDCLFC